MDGYDWGRWRWIRNEKFEKICQFFQDAAPLSSSQRSKVVMAECEDQGNRWLKTELQSPCL